MEQESENNAIVRAKADLADYDHKISVTRAEEERLAADRQRWEAERSKVFSFIEMYQKYAGDVSDEAAASGSDKHDQTEASKPNGAGQAGVKVHTGNGAARHSRKRRPPIHRKPPNTPTTHEMILVALRDAEKRGLTGLAPKDIANFMRQKWWPHLKGSSVTPAVWRMYQEKQLRKEGGLYALPPS